jgi:hypothetical protein
MKRCRASPKVGAGSNRSRPNASTSTSRDSRSGWAIAKRAAIAPPSPCPTSAGDDGQVRSSSAPSHPTMWSASSGPSAGCEAPWPGRSGATTRWVVTRSGMTRIQRAANSPELCSSTTGGPSPPSSTAVDWPASCSRRSVTGIAASNRWRASSPAARRPRSCRLRGLLVVACWSVRDLVMACPSLVWVVRSSGLTMEPARKPGIAGTTQLPPYGRRGYFPPEGGQMSWCW